MFNTVNPGLSTMTEKSTVTLKLRQAREFYGVSATGGRRTFGAGCELEVMLIAIPGKPTAWFVTSDNHGLPEDIVEYLCKQNLAEMN